MIDLNLEDRLEWEEVLRRAEEQFWPMPKIPRWSRPVIVSEKIDGTSGAILINDDGVFAGSKSRLLSPGKSTDNFGFAAWVQSCQKDLTSALGPGLHRGEWMGVGVNRNYGLIERRFYLFNVHKWMEPYQEGLLPPNVHVVPVLYRGPNEEQAITRSLELLREQGSYAAPGYRNPEGIVIYHVASGYIFKKTILNDEVPKEVIRKAKTHVPMEEP